MGENFYLGIDAGTTGIKAAVFDANGTPHGIGLKEYTLETPEPDIVELEVDQYWSSTKEAIEIAVKSAGISAKQIRALSITGQAETLILTDVAGRPLHKAIVWLDNRAVDEAQTIATTFGSESLFRMSGQTEMLPCWPAAKILWLRYHEPEIFAKIGKFLMVEDYLAWKLTGTFATCRGLMPSSLYFDIRTGQYDSRMLEFIGIKLEQLPELRDAGEPIGKCIKNDSIIAQGTQVAAAPIDHVCGNLGSGCIGKGVISETTGCTLALCVAFPQLIYDEQRRLSTFLGFIPGTFVLLPWAPTAGMLLKHFRDEFASDMSYPEFDREATRVEPGSNGLLLLPHCAGAVSPICNPQARGVAYGITLAHKRGHWARAIMESVAYLLRDNIEALGDLGATVSEIRALGGATKSQLWLQIKADVLNLPIVVTECEEATALGAAILGAVAVGDIKNATDGALHMVRTASLVKPSKNVATYQEFFSQYQKLNSLLMPTFGGKL